MILLIDNYDSFVFNLARYFERLGHETRVVRNDAIDIAAIRQMSPAAIVLSPGPCTPNEAGCSLQLVRELWHDFPMLGVCLGHQTIAAAFGAKIVRTSQPMHGRTSDVYHDGTSPYQSIPSPFTVCRYHSLIVDPSSLPDSLHANSRTSDGIVMGIQHATAPVVGVQFHPESILTEHGFVLLANFLRLAGLEPKEPPATQPERIIALVSPRSLPTTPVTF